ncbi:MAG TPA: methyl-accepting chemotaxis protein [Zoogloea sp.]|uniref:methyl-accepting chemotaxis protein n=1 Tax=Zoogloea sp. TaxID=49181 RepID=UPI002B8E7694|nr:methyl-accepting chemotaxis protein [Zoogloea sp.]HMV62487.1 methyl-accepting chemotaxis protein [Rhodocyclaceae bacterium]HMW51033.1 methyl-accepting chemotaxis protein [Rhodocyclaceae bacterium]HNB64102.1 methyl-accepting chemotaxis protein [Rhodocyclaceae bacterium]HNC78294.1 methyl-accepting chemotaxis protein [Rhodocyclaceae bacterium]HND25215.1 methyl-accepting chemotaxis protein [Rhodocyclaceae bacterium]
MNLNMQKIWVRLVIVIASLMALGSAGVLWWVAREQQHTAIEQAEEFAQSVHQMTMAQLMFAKATRNYKRQGYYLEQVEQSRGLRHLKVLRGAATVQQFGEREQGVIPADDPLEKAVLADGKARYEIREEEGQPVLKAVLPAIAEKRYLGKECLECHDEAKEGDVLGAVSMSVQLDAVKRNLRESLLTTVAVALLLGVVLVAAVYVFVRNALARPLNGMTRNLADIAGGEGDLTRRLKARRQDEVGLASAAFNRMMDSLQRLIGQVIRSSGDVAGAASALERGTARIADGSTEQARRSASAAAGMEEIVGSIAQVADLSTRVQALATHSMTCTHHGNETLTELDDKLHGIDRAVQEIVGTVENFVNRAESITAMTQQVKGISDQTNLLALNAAIEAARAGESGRGFAVVADEVRKLAEQSHRSAAAIDTITGALGEDSSAARTAIQHGLEVLRSSRESMRRVAEALGEANRAVEDAVRGTAEISAATGVQRDVSGRVAADVEGIAQLAERNGAEIADAAVAARQLAGLAAELQAETGRFRV